MSALFQNSIKVLISLILIALFTPSAFAQTNSVEATTSAATAQTAYIHPLSPQYANLTVINLIHTLSCFAEGASIIGQPCLEVIPSYNLYGLQPSSTSRGTVGAIASFLTALYSTPPTQTSVYLAELGKELSIIPEAKAQVSGSGDAILTPVKQIWSVARNLAYIVMIFVFIVIGFMIMFRQKINPQTVISAQAALPSLVVGLILITFSYFISSLLLDATFLTTRISANLVEGSILKPGSSENMLKNGSLFEIFNEFMQIKWPSEVIDTTIQTLSSLQSDKGGIGEIIENASGLGGCLVGIQLAPKWDMDIKPFGIGFKIPIGDLLAKGGSCLAGGGLAKLLYNVPGLTGTLTGLILYVVLIIALLIALFRLLFALITSYITIMIFTILSPFYFLFASIPGRQGASSTWFKTMVANLLAFPAVLAALIFASYILGINTGVIQTINGPIDFSTGTVPLLGGLNTSFLRIVLAYGVLLLTPAIPDLVKESLGVKGFAGFQTTIAGFTAGFGVARGGVNKTIAPIQQERQTFREQLWRARYGATTEEALRGKAPWYITMGNIPGRAAEKKESSKP